MWSQVNKYCSMSDTIEFIKYNVKPTETDTLRGGGWLDIICTRLNILNFCYSTDVVHCTAPLPVY